MMPLGGASVKFAWLEYLNAFRNVTRQYRRSLFGVSAVAFGVVALILAAGFIEWIFWATREGAIQTGLGHVHVMRPGYLDGGQADPLKYLLPQDSPHIEAIRKFPTVRAVAPRLAFNWWSTASCWDGQDRISPATTPKESCSGAGSPRISARR
jgi:hypothetical protein